MIRKAASATASPRVAIVGSGFAGVAAAVKLQRAGIHTFTIYERSDSVGGTWRDNTYPGCEVDTNSVLYAFSFTRPDWSRTHVRQPELRRYLEKVVDDFGLRPHVRLGTSVDEAAWDDDAGHYRLSLGDGTEAECDALISAVGFLNVPQYPDWPGLDCFTGPVFHTARWRHDVDLRDKRVAIVGTGSSAAQIVPEIAPEVAHLSVFQREPGWVLPKGDRDYTAEERAALATRRAWRKARLQQLKLVEKNLWRRGVYRVGSPVNTKMEQGARAYLEREFGERPDLRDALTPTYPLWGKRLIMASTFYPALKRHNVELVPRAVSSVTEHGVVDADGVEHACDVLVLATGFQPTNYLAHLRVLGRNGRSLHDHWAGEPRAFLGATVPGFPNFFMLYGPGTNGGEIVWMLERQAELAASAIARLARHGGALEVRSSWADRYHLWLQSTMKGTAWTVSNNYFKNGAGRIVTQWPFSPLTYTLLTKTLGRASMRSTPRRSGRTGRTRP